MSASPDPSLIRSPAGGSPAGGDPSRRLAALAEVLEAAHHRSPDRRASLVLVRGLATDAYELAVRPIDDGDVHGALLATTVASEYDAAGLVVRGRAHSLSGPDGIDHPVAVLGRACVAVMASRDGTVASVVRIDDAEPMVQVDTDAAGCPAPGSGRLLDALRRSMGLATPPPPGPVDALATGLWLHRILERAVDAAPVDLGAVDDLLPDLGDSWTELRRERVLGCWPELGVAPELADWMDDGMFARTCLGAFPEPIEVLVELSELLSPAVWQHVVAGLVSPARTTRPGDLAQRPRGRVTAT